MYSTKELARDHITRGGGSLLGFAATLDARISLRLPLLLQIKLTGDEIIKRRADLRGNRDSFAAFGPTFVFDFILTPDSSVYYYFRIAHKESTKEFDNTTDTRASRCFALMLFSSFYAIT